MPESKPIPRFPEFAPIDLGHLGEVAGILSEIDRPVSEYSFANLFLFREAHRYELSRHGGLLLITATGYDSRPYALPPWGSADGDAVREAAGLLFDVLESRGSEPQLFPVGEKQFKEVFEGHGFDGESDRDSADYVYLTENLANLPGKRYHKRKNRLSKFLREMGERYEYATLAAEHVEECKELAAGWCDERCSIERPSTYQETRAAIEALELHAELGLTGGVSKVDGEVVAYCLGERLGGPPGEETFVVHFEKARPDMDGAAQAINRDFCKYTIAGYKYVNREQDLGDPGLRKAKEAYHPEYLAAKIRVGPAQAALRQRR